MDFFFCPVSLRGRPDAKKPWLDEAILLKSTFGLAALPEKEVVVVVEVEVGTSLDPDARPMVWTGDGRPGMVKCSSVW